MFVSGSWFGTFSFYRDPCTTTVSISFHKQKVPILAGAHSAGNEEMTLINHPLSIPLKGTLGTLIRN